MRLKSCAKISAQRKGFSAMSGLIFLVIPLAWAFVFFIGMALHHEQRMAEIRYAERTGQPLPAPKEHGWASWGAKLGQLSQLSELGERFHLGKPGSGFGGTPASPAAAIDHSREIGDLRERIKVLERIATAAALENRVPDALAAEIEALRS
jgi:hypothetical protein